MDAADERHQWKILNVWSPCFGIWTWMRFSATHMASYGAAFVSVHSWSKAWLLLSPTRALAGRRSLTRTDGRMDGFSVLCVRVWVDICQRSVCIFMRLICHIFHLVQQFNQHKLSLFFWALLSLAYAATLFTFSCCKSSLLKGECSVGLKLSVVIFDKNRITEISWILRVHLGIGSNSGQCFKRQLMLTTSTSSHFIPIHINTVIVH
jgi:hypothetical protein